jgi:hypothetical protein
MTPPASPVSDFAVPDDLAEHDQWVLWRYEARNGKQTKVPYQVSGSRADVSNARTWAPLQEARNVWRRSPQRYAGLGFVFSKDDGFAGIDLDDSLDDQHICKPWARGIVERFADTYMEISPSGKGLKIFARGAVPAALPGVAVGDGQIEIYDRSRYFAVTGRAYRGAPLQIEDHAADLMTLYKRLAPRRGGHSFQPLPGGRIPFGRQHSTLVSLCGTLRRKGVSEEAIEACLQTVNSKQCEAPASTAEISRIVRSSRRWAQK